MDGRTRAWFAAYNAMMAARRDIAWAQAELLRLKADREANG